MPIIELSSETLEKDFKRNIIHIEKSTSLSSSSLYHYTDTFKVLKEIITNGFKPSEGDGEVQPYQFDTYELRALMTAFGFETEEPEILRKPIVCFCDIPVKLAKIHRNNYGYYAIGLKKEWGISNTVSPLIYMPIDTNIHGILSRIFASSKREFGTGEYDEMPIKSLEPQINRLRHYIKPYQNQESKYKYYDEREWRYVIPTNSPLDYSDPQNFLKFQRKDIVQIIVRKTSEKKILLDLLKNLHGGVKNGIIKVRNH